jgi:hypothetical protein
LPVAGRVGLLGRAKLLLFEANFPMRCDWADLPKELVAQSEPEIELVALSARNDATDSASWIFYVAIAPRDEVKVRVQNGLASTRPVIGPEIETGYGPIRCR